MKNYPGRGHPSEVLLGPSELLLFFFWPGFSCFQPGEFWDPHRGTEAGVFKLGESKKIEGYKVRCNPKNATTSKNVILNIIFS